MTDVTILDADCTEIAHWKVKDTFVGEGSGFPGSIVIASDGRAVRDESDAGSAGSEAITTSACPSGPAILP